MSDNKVDAASADEPIKEPSVSPSKKETDVASSAFNHLAAGKRHLAVEDYKNAVADLEEACKLFGEVFGEDGAECGDAYYYYGSALLDMARQEHGVFGLPESEEASAEDDSEDQKEEESEKGEKSDINGTDNPNEEEKDDNPNEEVKDVENEKSEEEEKGDDEVAEDEETKEEEGSVENNKVETTDETEQSEATDMKPTQVEQEEEEEAEDVSNLQLAWEVLELAKVIFNRREKEGVEMSKKLALVYMKLGEVSLESENYPQSIADLKSCLHIRKNIHPSHHREIAEVHYQLATALQFDKQYDQSIQHYHNAMKVLEEKIEYLNKVIERREAKERGENITGDDGSAERERDAFYSEADEIDEIKNLLPDIKEKIVDTKDLKAEYLKKLGQLSEHIQSGEASGSAAIFQEAILKSNEPSAVSAASPTKPTSNISHLVKRKRKPEEELQAEDDKKAKVINGVEEKQKVEKIEQLKKVVL